ncbi:chemotaxis protein CheA [Thalassolituus oleivorans]|jgi:two-component system chemotaxis sensor kinase CheA|uniref:chemotaxis protein CheA n=1 Tax=Thalassolituus oleivorans TaxID=187493 RepID=UPI00042DDD76|nr:chemotaxis protein CheA [Thalassolituus oleivorans]AHK15321.1 chemotaxis protein [Thalassolituus oleivorans R6-15]APR66480.1 chemotaxis protein CheA [Thalassolituus oleivorans]
MSVDLSQFHQVFFEESFEGLDIMESQLVDMSPETVDDEIVNTIFRAAHSIKGGAGTFGFMPVSEFTHVVETLLDEIRAGKRAMESEYIDLFLQSVDCLREMLGAMQAGNAPETARPAEIKVAFEAILNAGAPKAKNEEVASDGVNAESEMIGWRIEMRPHIDMLRTGNEPFRMFRELRDVVGEEYLNVEAHLENLPEFTSINPEECYIYWTLTINTPANIDYIRAVFEWVEDDCDIEYHEIHNENAELSKPTDIAVESPEISSDAVDSVDAASSEPVAPPAAKSASPKATAKNAESSSIRVSIDKVDSLINMVGELVITQSMLGQLGQDFDMSRLAKLQEGLSQLEQNTRELQESVMKIRMMPISFAFSRFPRLVRDLGNQLSKKVNLVTLGENTELDKTVMEKIGDPLVHLVRNSLDHGLETTEQRIANGKSEEGTITLNAFHQGGNIVIEVADDGAGLNEQRILDKAKQKGLVPENQVLTPEEIHQLIFLPGFSTADVVSDISGRGVGMDVVRRNISALNGTIEVRSQRGIGSTFIIRLPLTLAILDGQLVKVCDETYIFPLVSIVESIQVNRRSLSHITGSQYVMQLRDEYIPILRLDGIFGLRKDEPEPEELMLVVVEGDNEKIGVVVDDLMGQQQVVIKSLEQNYEKVLGVSGATILGDGTVALIIDISGLGKTLDQMKKRSRKSERAA